MAWLHIARHGLRPAARQTSTWRARIAYGCVFAFVTAWAAAAPQAALSLGERLRLSFNALLFVCVALAATSGLRRSAGIIEDREVSLAWRDRSLSRLLSNSIHAAQDLLPAIPFFILLCALHVISPLELFTSASMITLVLLAACATPHVRISMLSIAALALLFLTWRRNSFEKAICALLALHIATKAFILWHGIARTHRLKHNLMHEAVTGLDPVEFAACHRKNLRDQFAAPLFCVAGINVVFVLLLLFAVRFPITMEQRLALGFALVGGAALLFVDASALAWRGLLSGVTTHNVHRSFATIFATIVGIPWAVAWVFSAFHAGEPMTLNEGAAYFFLWIGLGAAISWFARSTAKEKLQRDLRRMLAEQ
ncbi:MAG TPA: hypothetical protein VM680_01885 [Verrucomicrobiae bacterium]|nr:hypothetical protein [Verrucomicrobiae bacterium]